MDWQENLSKIYYVRKRHKSTYIRNYICTHVHICTHTHHTHTPYMGAYDTLSPKEMKIHTQLTVE